MIDNSYLILDKRIELKGIIFEDFVNYKKPSMTLMFPKCDFKCDYECGESWCQNWELAAAPSQMVNIKELLEQYKSNPITEAIVLQGLEPLDSLIDVCFVAACLANLKIADDLVIYTGYTKTEVPMHTIYQIAEIIPGNLIMKWGRFKPRHTPHYDPVLGVKLASDNQYGELITK